MIEETPIIEALVALLIAVLAYLTNKYRARAADIELFYDPDTAHRVPPKVIDTLKDTTWKMPSHVKEFACKGLSSADVFEFYRQVDEAEAAHSVRYVINLSNIVYRVEYGQLVGALVKEEWG
jgi:hypothetical protein